MKDKKGSFIVLSIILVFFGSALYGAFVFVPEKIQRAKYIKKMKLEIEAMQKDHGYDLQGCVMCQSRKKFLLSLISKCESGQYSPRRCFLAHCNGRAYNAEKKSLGASTSCM